MEEMRKGYLKGNKRTEKEDVYFGVVDLFC